MLVLLFLDSVSVYAFRILRCKRMRSAIMAMNSLLVGFPFVFSKVNYAQKNPPPYDGGILIFRVCA